MTTITDSELGEIIVRRQARSQSVRIRVGTDRRFVVTAPPYTPLFMIKRIVAGARDELRAMIATQVEHQTYVDGQAIGQSHVLAVVASGMVNAPTVKVARDRLIVMLPPTYTLDDSTTQHAIREGVVRVLRLEAKRVLPERLRTLAHQYGFRYDRVRLSHAGSRWGSCSSSGTISLNIALMKLANDLIDYVIIHELCHTVHMNHSPKFWELVGTHDPHYRLHRRQIKQQTPTI